MKWIIRSLALAIFFAAPCVAQTPDPAQLPVATTSQIPLTAAYNALNVPGLAAGQSYLDPTTNVKIWKLTSARFPVLAPNWGHDYGEGGNEISLPYNGDGVTRAVLVYDWLSDTAHYIIDFNPSKGVSNVRLLSGSMKPDLDLAFTFSSNPATPYYAYLANGRQIIRIDIRKMSLAPGNGWPVNIPTTTPTTWLHQAVNDSFFVWMNGPNGPNIVGYNPATRVEETYTNSNANEPRIDRAGRYILVSMSTPQNQGILLDYNNNMTVIYSTPTASYGSLIPIAHQGSLSDLWVGEDYNLAVPCLFWEAGLTLASVQDISGSGPTPGYVPAGGEHTNGNWIQPSAGLNQWAMTSIYGGETTGSEFLSPGGLVLWTVNGARRLFVHHYNSSTTYNFFPFPKFSSDGFYVMFTSNMNGSARSDVFLAQLPTTGPAAPAVRLSPASLAFPNTTAGNTSSQLVSTLTNNGRRLSQSPAWP